VRLLRWAGAVVAVVPLVPLFGLVGWMLAERWGGVTGAVLGCLVAVGFLLGCAGNAAESGCVLVMFYVLLLMALLLVSRMRDTAKRQERQQFSLSPSIVAAELARSASEETVEFRWCAVQAQARKLEARLRQAKPGKGGKRYGYSLKPVAGTLWVANPTR
jgi:hypothetical protein